MVQSGLESVVWVATHHHDTRLTSLGLERFSLLAILLAGASGSICCIIYPLSILLSKSITRHFALLGTNFQEISKSACGSGVAAREFRRLRF